MPVLAIACICRANSPVETAARSASTASKKNFATISAFTENVALESTRIIEIDEFVEKSEIEPRYLVRPDYLRPDGKVRTTPSLSSESPLARWARSRSAASC